MASFRNGKATKFIGSVGSMLLIIILFSSIWNINTHVQNPQLDVMPQKKDRRVNRQVHNLQSKMSPDNQDRHWHQNFLTSKENWLQLVKRYIKPPIDGTYGSHVIPLLAAAVVTTGPIFEMGSGYYSTPMLSELVVKQNRFLLTADTDKNWLMKFTKYESENHRLYHVNWTKGPGKEWDSVGNDHIWSLVFIDQRPSYRRVVDMLRFKNKVPLIVAHDTQVRHRKRYHYNDEIDKFAASFTFTHFPAHTTVMSNLNKTLVDAVVQLVNWTDSLHLSV